MNRRILLTWVVFLVSICSFGQNEPLNWFFGNKASISFSTNPPSAFNINGFYAPEGSAAISSPSGKLLFYTDGARVYSANNIMMPNGNKLLGDPGATQSSIIVPKPKSNGHYYVFTLDAGGGSNGLTYSEVDMSLNYGNGDVISSGKNISLNSPLAEKLTAIRHSNGTDYWVLVHGIDNTNKTRFFAYKVTEYGPSTTPVTSETGSSHNAGFGSVLGYMKFSPNGKKVACAVGGSGSFVEIFNFDDASGTVSEPMRIDFSTAPYGLEFSPDSKRIYVSAGSKIYQYTLPETQNTGLLLFSEKIMTADANVWALQLGIDHKIYTCKQGNKIGIINAPNNDASTANFVDNSFGLENGTGAIQGFPNFMPHYFNENYIDAENLCVGQGTRFSLYLNGLDSVVWNFGDAPYGGTPNFVKGPTPVYAYKAPGTYTVTATIFTGSFSTVISKKIDINPLPVFSLGNDTVMCKGQVLNLKLNIAGASYLWSDGSKAPNRNITTPGVHFVDVTAAGCTVRDSVKVVFDIVRPDVLVNKFTQCLSGNEFQFTSGGTNIATHTWMCNDTLLGVTPGITKSFSSPGAYNIIHIVKSLNNCVDSGNAEIIVYNDIKADFDIVVNEGCGPANNFDFIDKTVYGGTYTATYEIEGRNIPKNNLNWNFSGVAGVYTVKFKVTSNEGCSNEIEKKVTVYAKPDANFDIVFERRCSNNHLVKVEKAIPLSRFEKITWYAGNLKVVGNESMQVSIPKAGKHTIKAVVTNPAGCTAVFEQEIEIFEAPLADFTTSLNTLHCLGNKNIQFVDNSKSVHPINSYLWDFGDKTTSTAQNPVKDFDAEADYMVSLTVTNDKGCQSTSSQTLSTFEKPDTRISANIISPCFDDNAFLVSFKNVNPSASVTSYFWQDELGKIYNANPLSLSFSTPGNHTLKLVVSTANGCLDSGYTTFNVFENPTGEIVYAENERCMSEDFGFSAKLSPTSAPISKYLWNLGNGNTADGPAVVSKYNRAGNYTVGLKVTDLYGCNANFAPVDIVVHPVPVFEIVSTETCVNEPVKMEITGLDRFISVGNWHWNFGDGYTSKKAEPTHTYNVDGVYKVQASVTSDWGCTYQATNDAGVKVNPLPDVDFAYHKDQWSFDETVVSFDALTSSDIVSHTWNFGNGRTSTEPNEAIRFDKAGYYTISLSVTNNKGCSNNVQKDILVVPPFDAYVPTGFTPNGDGKNDYFGMEGVQFINSFKMQIFNRWGQQIFVSESLDVKWDGRSNGTIMPPDVYSYAINLTDAEGRPYSLSGIIELIR